MYVHQDNIEEVGLTHINRRLAVLRHRDVRTQGREHQTEHLSIAFVVVYDKDPHGLERATLMIAGSLDSAFRGTCRKDDMEAGTNAWVTVQLNSTANLLSQIPADRQTQTNAVMPARRGAINLSKGLENSGMLADAYSGPLIFDLEEQAAI